MNLTKDELIIALQDMTNTFKTNILYKYRADNDYTENIIKNSALWFSRPKEFNDPFDCYSVPAPFSKQDAEKWMYSNALYKNATEEDKKKAKENIRNHSLMDVKFCIDAAINNNVICCFNRTEKEILMWSHYSDKHQGLCFQFDIEKDPNLFVLPFDVKYVSSISPINIFKGELTNERIKQIIAQKYTKWGYEQEVRVIKYTDEINLSNVDKGKAIKFNPEALRKIIFGCKASKETISKYKSLCANNGFNHVEFSQMHQKMDGSFDLEEELNI